MSDESVQVTVTAQSNVLGLTAGQTATVERTPLVQVHIDARHLAEAAEGEHSGPDDADPTNDPDGAADDGSDESSAQQ